MILIGQYDSPFVRRVGIALALYGIPFKHTPWSVFGDAAKLRDFNPLMRVPTLVLDDGEVLGDSHLILDYLDNIVSDHETMFPKTEPDRHRHLAVAALATGLGDKCVSLFYERRLHDAPSPVWTERLTAQIGAAMARLEADRAARSTACWFGDRIGHADVAVACVLRFGAEALPDAVDLTRFPALAAHCARLEATEVFRDISQPFAPPA
jgi:glutathione S-transferase